MCAHCIKRVFLCCDVCALRVICGQCVACVPFAIFAQRAVSVFVMCAHVLNVSFVSYVPNVM